MESYGTYEARNRLSELLDKAERGEEIIITRNGKAVAKLVRVDEAEEKKKRRREAVEGFRALREGMSEDVLEGTTIRALIEEGRR